MKEYIVSLRCVKPNDKSFLSNMRRDNDSIAQQAADANSLLAAQKKHANLVNNHRVKRYFLRS